MTVVRNLDLNRQKDGLSLKVLKIKSKVKTFSRLSVYALLKFQCLGNFLDSERLELVESQRCYLTFLLNICTLATTVGESPLPPI